MTWQDLLADGRVRTHTASRQELDALRSVIDRDLADASIPSLSPDRRFATAYNAVLQLTKMVVACAGYRIAARSGHHQTSLSALELALGHPVPEWVDYFDACRRKRNRLDYDVASVVTGTEAEELLSKAQEFRDLIEQWITQNRPQLAV